MATVHLLNVSPGDCTIIRHNSERVTVMDICDGNLNESATPYSLSQAFEQAGGLQNFRMCEWPINPITYAKSIGINSIFRFILSHPDMDHMDGFASLISTFGCLNFWDTGARKPKPDFSGSPYNEADWNTYVRVRDNKIPGTASVIRQAGDEFSYANKKDSSGGAHDGLLVLAPDNALIDDPNIADDVNEGSYVIMYNSSGGKIILPGDAHDASWEYVRKHHLTTAQNCAFLLAPHHGRDSGRSYDFLDMLNPKLTLIGCAPSKHIDYGQWSRRNLEIITSNQCGNVVLEIADCIDVYIENKQFAVSRGLDTSIINSQGYIFFKRLPN